MIHILRNILLTSSACLLSIASLGQSPLNGPAPRTAPYAGQAERDGSAHGRTIVQGDIILDKAAVARRGVNPKPQSLTVASTQSLWPQVGGVATVYYVIDAASDPNATPNINTAIAQSNADFPGLLQWVPWTSADGPNYVDINLSADDFSGECEAAEGYDGVPAQPMTGSTACAIGTILHEMGHVIGLWHEFQRPDRDNYVSVNYNNVIKGSWGNFETISQNAQVLGLYDYASLMQYPPYSFSRNGGPVIETIPAGMPLGSAEGVPVPAFADYSAGDKETIERLYGTPPTQVTITSNPVGLQVEVDGATVTTPQTYAWALNSTHTLAVAAGVQTLTGDIENSTTSATFYYTYGRWNDSTGQSHTIAVLPGDGGTGFPVTGPQVATYSANFIELVPYTSTVYPASIGTVSISPTPQSYPGISGQFFVARQSATLTATPASGWNFYEFNNGPFWLPGGLGANPKTFYVPDTGNPVNTTAEFTNAPVYTVDITPETFSSNLSVYVDGDFAYTPINFSPYYDTSWTSGSSHSLAFFSPEYPYSINSRYAFSSWSDGGAASHGISSLPATSTSYIATVTPQFAPATNFSYPPCGGSGTLMPTSPTGDGFYPTGQVLTYSATPTAGFAWDFAGWTYDLTGTTNPANLIANDETLVFANFNIVSAPLTLTSLSPSAADTGSSAFTLTLTGTGFSPNSNVSVNGIYRTVTYVNAQTLQVPMTAADIASPGALQVFVENFPSGWNGCAVFGYQTFIVHGSNLATSTAVSSSSNPVHSGSSVTFTAVVTSSENNATGSVTFMDGATVLGAGTLSGAGIASYATSALAAGTHGITAVYGGDSNNSGSTSSVLTQTVTGPAALVSPTPGSVLSGANVTFTWTAGGGVGSYQFQLGTTGVGSSNVYNSGHTSGLSASVTGMPTYGQTIYARLYSEIGGVWSSVDYTYTEAGSGIPAALSTPAPGSVLSGSNVTFTWTAGQGVMSYQLVLGTTGVGSSNVYSSGHTTALSANVTGLPTYGQAFYARLYSEIKGVWTSVDYTYTEAGSPLLAVLSTPAPSSVLSGSSVTFTWTTGGGVKAYQLDLGTLGVGSSNLYNSGHITALSTAVTGLPTYGQTIYARLYSDVDTGVWESVDFTYTEAGAPILAALSMPTPGSVLSGSSATFTWTAGGGIELYQLYLGTTGAGSSNLYNSGHTTALSANVTGIPTFGQTIYARLFSDASGTWKSVDYTYTEAGTPVASTLTSPTPGTTLSGSSVMFTWSTGGGVSMYQLFLGSTGAGSSNLYNSGHTTATSASVTGLPTNGAKIYARLYSEIGGTWSSIDYTYTAQ